MESENHREKPVGVLVIGTFLQNADFFVAREFFRLDEPALIKFGPLGKKGASCGKGYVT